MEASFKLHQIDLKTTASIRKTKTNNRDMVPDSITLFETYKSFFFSFLFLKNKTMKLFFYKLSGVVRHFDFMLSLSRNLTTVEVITFCDTAVLHY